jgi:hypothetical protein
VATIKHGKYRKYNFSQQIVTNGNWPSKENGQPRNDGMVAGTGTYYSQAEADINTVSKPDGTVEVHFGDQPNAPAPYPFSFSATTTLVGIKGGSAIPLATFTWGFSYDSSGQLHEQPFTVKPE